MNTYRYATIATVLLTSVSVHAQQAVQWKVSDGGNGHWYQWIHQLSGVSWAVARDTCLDDGGHLATPTSMAENQFVFGLTLPTSLWPYRFGPWLGGYQDLAAADFSEPAGGWRWVTGEAWAWTAWWPGEPTNFYCVTSGEDKLHYIDYQPMWNDITNLAGDCEQPNWSYIVEWSADCNSDGIVDYGQCHDGTLPDYNGNNVPDCCERGEACAVGSYPVQWRIEDGGNGHWYDQRIWTGPKSIVGISASYVAQIGAHAVTITSPSENEFVYRAVHSRTSGATHGGYSILGGYQDPGASDYSEPAGGWRWVTGEPMTYLNWGPALPDNCCGGESVLQYPNASYWNDAETAGVPAGHRYRVIVEWDADCNQDGIVDKGQILQGELADQNVDGIPDTCQCGTIPSLPGCCPGDLDHDRAVGGADIGLLLSNWGPCGSACPYDLNNDTKVNGGDLGLLLAGWGPCQ